MDAHSRSIESHHLDVVFTERKKSMMLIKHFGLSN